MRDVPRPGCRVLHPRRGRGWERPSHGMGLRGVEGSLGAFCERGMKGKHSHLSG